MKLSLLRCLRVATPAVFVFATAMTSAGCAVPQSDACAKFVDCQAHYNETYSLTPANTDAYAADGVCWSNTTRADDCTDACNVANEVLERGLNDSGDDPGPCAGS